MKKKHKGKQKPMDVVLKSYSFANTKGRKER